ncbi:hypothetical protein JOS77_06755 [Chromobacterium haemolyticum]|nr:hypothetical protein JOS77_06755 [Chromobacterium haemolyticum]
MQNAEQTARPRRAYGPRGTSKVKVVQMRLLPAERSEFDQAKAAAGCSESKLARDIYLLGLAAWKASRAGHV